MLSDEICKSWSGVSPLRVVFDPLCAIPPLLPLQLFEPFLQTTACSLLASGLHQSISQKQINKNQRNRVLLRVCKAYLMVSKVNCSCSESHNILTTTLLRNCYIKHLIFSQSCQFSFSSASFPTTTRIICLYKEYVSL